MEQKLIKEEISFDKKLMGLDGIRTIACLFVIAHHIFQTLNPILGTDALKNYHSFFSLVGNAGTSIFFVLSGFLLSYPFWKNYYTNKEFPNIKDYLIKRMARIVPGFYIAIIASVIVTIVLEVDVEYLWQRALAAVTFISGFNYKTFFPTDVNGALWSISFEVFWYMLLPVFMFILYKLGKKRSTYKAIIFWIVSMIVVLNINKLIHTYFTPDNINRGWQYGIIGGAKYWMPNYNPIGMFSQFIVGILSAAITTNYYIKKKNIEGFQRFYGFDIVAIIAIILAIKLLGTLRFIPEFEFSIGRQPYFFPLFQILIGLSIIALPHTKILGKIFDNPFCAYTSKVSFGLYLWHHLIISIVSKTIEPKYIYGGMININSWVKISLLIILVSYIIASISYFFVEKPVLNKAHKLKR